MGAAGARKPYASCWRALPAEGLKPTAPWWPAGHPSLAQQRSLEERVRLIQDQLGRSQERPSRPSPPRPAFPSGTHPPDKPPFPPSPHLVTGGEGGEHCCLSPMIPDGRWCIRCFSLGVGKTQARLC